MHRVALACGLAAALAACGHPPSGSPPGASTSGSSEHDLSPLATYEASRHASADLGHAPPSDRSLGPDPYVLRRLPGAPDRFVGALRGRASIVLLDAELHELSRLAAPDSPSGVAATDSGDVFVVGDLTSAIFRYRKVGSLLRSAAPIELADVRGLRDVATGPEGVVYAVEEHDGRLLTLKVSRRGVERRADLHVGHGPVRVARVGRFVIVNSVVDHVLTVLPVGPDGFPQEGGEARIVHDGPFWGFDAVADGDGLVLAASGVEDHPLDRTQGSFAFIDSFVYLYRVENGVAVRRAAVDVSDFDVVVPKAVVLERSGGALRVTAVAAGSAQGVRIEWPAQAGEPTTATFAVPPGTSSATLANDERIALADPLLDAWVLASGEGPHVVSVDDPSAMPRSEDSRLGEALVFTTLMAPWNRSEGRLSRFTCETCHFEGYVDGRTHHTGRGDVHATTKPLLGLFNNRPHFSRALDPNLTSVADNEFRVAGAKSDHDPWFSLETREHPWLASLGVTQAVLSPLDLRRAFMAFLMDFSHRPNPSVFSRSSFDDEERLGAEVFRDRCARCHEARLAADEPESRIPFEAWEGSIFCRETPIVWASDAYEKTGVTPYVHERGARVPSLRRLYKKYPYFTNGSAKSIDDVLDRARWGDGSSFFHDAPPAEAPLHALDAREKSALLRFLDLL